MPWIDGERCTGCGLCVEKCPVNAVTISDEVAEIHMAKCIRCGVCHDICPQECVRHDSEKVPENVETNVEMTKHFMELCATYLGDDKEREKCLERMKKHFHRELLIAERTLAELERLETP